MAAMTPFASSLPHDPALIDFVTEATVPRTLSNLPSGACNFTDLTPGANGACCGCRRFWARPSSRVVLGDAAQSENAFLCMCSHHACYHDHTPPVQTPLLLPPPIESPLGAQENERATTSGKPLGDIQQFPSFRLPSQFSQLLELTNFDFGVPGPSPQPPNSTSLPTPHVPPACTRMDDDSLPDTLSWRDVSAPQPPPVDSMLPLIPSQCYLPSQPLSTSSSQARYLLPFAGKGLNTLAISLNNYQQPQPQQPLTPQNQGPACSLSAQTPKIDMDECPPDYYTDMTNLNTPRSRIEGEQHQGDHPPANLAEMDHRALRKISGKLQSHEQRLDLLENTSFSLPGHDECNEKLDENDLRMTEIESRVEEIEKIVFIESGFGAGGQRNAARDIPDDLSTSVVSTVSAASNTSNSELYGRIQALEAQLEQLKSASMRGYSYTNPWELEVVFLPFPLKGIWIRSQELASKIQRRSDGVPQDGLTQPPNTIRSMISRAASEPPQSPYLEWDGQDADSGWLLPRACTPGRLIDNRLKSRGLVRTILVRGTDARSVQVAMAQTFGDIFQVMSVSSRAGPLIQRASLVNDPRLTVSLGLRHPWVPLRKLHKDSRLRFLTPAEMSTPTLWDVSYLRSSVVMKATGTQRLYVTQPEAYIQDHHLGQQAFESGWTWQKLRDMPSFSSESQDSTCSSRNSHASDSETASDCWAWNERLDSPPLAYRPPAAPLRLLDAGLVSQKSSVEPSEQFYTGVEPSRSSMSPLIFRSQSPLVSRERNELVERVESRNLRVRTHSLPAPAPARSSPATCKRRISLYAINGGHQHERKSSPLVTRNVSRPPLAATTTGTVGRRRGIRSPALACRDTPRWGRPHMSRSPSLAPPGQVPPEECRSERRTTPFCYATPYSNAPPESHGRLVRAGSHRPVSIPPGGDDENMEDYGSASDSYQDSEMTNEADDERYETRVGFANNASMGGITVFEDDDGDMGGDDALDSVEIPVSGGHGVLGSPPVPGPSAYGFGKGLAQDSQLPEDEPWPGIEEDNMSDGENVDPHSAELVMVDANNLDDGGSVASSVPSEYPSTSHMWNAEPGQAPPPASQQPQHLSDHDVGSGDIGFKIHEDADMDMDNADTPWD